ncbi:MAG TPA: segregation/condensation protein A [Limnochordia bacterium]|nr:segregation/condensation protein A [Limnochordia bacterium]
MSPDFDAFTLAPEGWEVELDQFEGPLALLLQLIRRQKLDILDIPVARITAQYIAHLDAMQPLLPELAADYLWMAATLLAIKSRMLTPRPQEAGDEDGEDPRTELVLRLLEYQRFKARVPELVELSAGRERLYRAAPRLSAEKRRPLYPDPAGGAGPDDLRRALLERLRTPRTPERAPPANPIQLREVSVFARAGELRTRLASGTALDFDELCRTPGGRSWWVVTFLAVLELVRRGEADVVQSERFGPMRLLGREGGAEQDAGAADLQEGSE